MALWNLSSDCSRKKLQKEATQEEQREPELQMTYAQRQSAESRRQPEDLKRRGGMLCSDDQTEKLFSLTHRLKQRVLDITPQSSLTEHNQMSTLKECLESE